MCKIYSCTYADYHLELVIIVRIPFGVLDIDRMKIVIAIEREPCIIYTIFIALFLINFKIPLGNVHYT